MKAIINGRLLMPEGEIRGKALLYEEKIIGTADPAETAGADVLDAGGAYVAPALIDTHIHGYRGKDASDGDAEGLLRMAAEITENGVTAFLPTTMTIPFPMLEEAFRSIRRAGMISREKSFAGAEILGCHAEGPFISPDRKGAQAEDAILPPDADAVAAYQDVIRIMTYAPERKGAAEMARRIRNKGASAILDAKEFTESPDNQVRCMDRYLLGHLDNEWFMSEAFWEYYCERLASARE